MWHAPICDPRHLVSVALAIFSFFLFFCDLRHLVSAALATISFFFLEPHDIAQAFFFSLGQSPPKTSQKASKKAK